MIVRHYKKNIVSIVGFIVRYDGSHKNMAVSRILRIFALNYAKGSAPVLLSSIFTLAASSALVFINWEKYLIYTFMAVQKSSRNCSANHSRLPVACGNSGGLLKFFLSSVLWQHIIADKNMKLLT